MAKKAELKMEIGLLRSKIEMLEEKELSREADSLNNDLHICKSILEKYGDINIEMETERNPFFGNTILYTKIYKITLNNLKCLK